MAGTEDGSGTGSLVLVVGASGGVGASTMACVLAAELAADGTRVGLVDLDPLSGGLDVLLGIEARPGARWSELADVRGEIAAGDLDDVLLPWRGVEVLSAGRYHTAPAPAAVSAVLAALITRNDHVVVDLPARGLASTSGTGPLGAPDHVVLVAGQDVRGVAGALAIRDRIPSDRAHLVLRARPDPVVAPAEAARLLDLPLLATLPRDHGVPGAVDRGLGPVPARRSRLARAVRSVAVQVSGRG